MKRRKGAQNSDSPVRRPCSNPAPWRTRTEGVRAETRALLEIAKHELECGVQV